MEGNGLSGTARSGKQAAALPSAEASPKRRWGAGSRRGELVRRRLLIADAVGLALAFLIAQLLFGHTSTPSRLSSTEQYLFFVATIPGWVVLAKLYQLYDHDDERTDHSTLDDVVGVFHLATVGAWLGAVVIWASGAAGLGMTKLVTFWALAVLFITTGRAVARAASHRSPAYVQNAIVVGAGDVGQLIARKLLQHREYGVRVVGFVDDEPKALRADLGDLNVLGGPSEVAELVRRHGVERVVVAFSQASHEQTLDVIRELKKLDVQIDIVPRLFEVIGPHVSVNTVEGVALVALPTAKRFPGSRAIKRTMDVAGALALLAVTAPMFAYFAWRIRRDSPGPVIFRQTRLGHHGVPFTVLKFRTMRLDVDKLAHREFIKQMMSSQAVPTENGLYKLNQDDAVTPFGRFLRKTSLDELPNLINVLRGEMSLVGPRPCLEYETEHFQPHHFERFDVPQGITGLWQVAARAHATFGEALDLDVLYARSWSILLDLQLLLRTPLHVLRREGTV
jgi:exopolysaccharide biosynthesis polyprenyl glycosylphosphotransferase